MCSRARLVVTAVLALLAFAAPTMPAFADGDPASDYLLTEDVFVPLDAQVSTPLAQELAGLALDAKRKGYTIKIAVIATPADLGAITALWRRPQQYARFLGQELRFIYRGRLLIVMPNGFGIYHLRHPTSDERKVLAPLTVGPTGNDLTRAATLAVKRLAAANGLALKPVRVGAPSGTTTRDRVLIVVIVLAVLVLLAAVRSLLLDRRRRRRTDAPIE
jgi:hypothetical protein